MTGMSFFTTKTQNLSICKPLSYRDHCQEQSLRCSKAANTPEMNACLTFIRDASTQGITSKAIRNKIGPNEITVPVIRKAIEALEKSAQIKSFKSIHVSVCLRLEWRGKKR